MKHRAPSSHLKVEIMLESKHLSSWKGTVNHLQTQLILEQYPQLPSSPFYVKNSQLRATQSRKSNKVLWVNNYFLIGNISEQL